MNDPERRLGIAGTGRVATALGELFRIRGIEVISGSRGEGVRRLASSVDRILIAVSDDAIADVAMQLAANHLRNAIVLHTSGAVGPEALDSLSVSGNAVGVLHPLQTIPDAARGIATLPGATYSYAGDSRACEWALELIRLLEGKPLAVRSDRWPHYHAAAVMACNYHVTLIDAALELMQEAGIERSIALDALAPIVRATTDNVLRVGPELALTGPIRRGDVGTLLRHQNALMAVSKETQSLYRAAAERTLQVAARAGLPPTAVHEMAAALSE